MSEDYRLQPGYVIPYSKQNLLILYDLNAVPVDSLTQFALEVERDTGTRIRLIPCVQDEGPPLRIWDLDNIQNGEPIPPEIIEKLKETAGAA